MNLRPPRPERGALPGCATLRHALFQRDRPLAVETGAATSPVRRGLIASSYRPRKRRVMPFSTVSFVPSRNREKCRRQNGFAPFGAALRAPCAHRGRRGCGLCPHDGGLAGCNGGQVASCVPGRLHRLAGGTASRYTKGRGRRPHVGASPSGKAAAFGAAIRRFESCRPSHPSFSTVPSSLTRPPKPARKTPGAIVAPGAGLIRSRNAPPISIGVQDEFKYEFVLLDGRYRK